MCGIAGYFSNTESTEFEVLNDNVDKHLNSRGPDNSGICYFDKEWKHSIDKYSPEVKGVFWHKRLSIIDIGDVSNQPMMHSSGKVIIFNGEIYNYIELRNELLMLGHYFNTHSDTEVILAAFDQWGLSCFGFFIGMFAVAIADPVNETITIARDSLGIKPLYYSDSEKRLAFSSRADLTAKMIGNNRYNTSSVFNFIVHGISDNDEYSMFEGVKSLLPGEIRVYSGKELTLIKSDKIDYHNAKNTLQDNSLNKAERLKALLLDSVRLHTRTDVGFCTTLSGGMDSTSIIGMLKEIGISNIIPFSYIPDNDEISEKKWIDIAAEYYGLETNLVRYNSEDFWADMNDFVDASDLPVNSMSMYSQYKLYQAISQAGHKVVLDGQGGDEMFAGYVQYLYYRAYEDLLKWKLKSFIKLLDGAKETVSYSFMGRNTLRLLLYNNLPYMYKKMKLMESDPIIDFNYFRSNEWIKELNYDYETNSLKNKLQNDLKYQDLPRLLRYADRSSMRWSLESRVPFATQPILSFIEGLDNVDFVSAKGVTKSIFRTAIEDVLPSQIYRRRDKKGFNTDYHSILYSDKLYSIINIILSAKDFPFINKSELKKALKRTIQYPPEKLWRLVSFILWTDSKSLN